MNQLELLKALEVVFENTALDDEALVGALVRAGVSKNDAEVVVALVPIAFGRPLLEELGVTGFAEVVSARSRQGKWVEVPLNMQSIYVQALALAREHWKSGCLNRDGYKQVAFRSPEVDAVNNALNSGADVRGGTVASALLDLSAESLGYA